MTSGKHIEQPDFILRFLGESVEIEGTIPGRTDTLSLPAWAFEPLTVEQALNLANLFLDVHYGAKLEDDGFPEAFRKARGTVDPNTDLED
ncbi:hypothetical protein [Salipiger bermudensis]|uniref:hypothetical protein n=1 Tax=Salipiger bermudensis TaxID=344736 RepID=UPI001A8D6A78|nr:hypothetical protein [Salipiger bermudensis]MBN9678850.1 hypothetical protein [Salipiger bermudensis]